MQFNSTVNAQQAHPAQSGTRLPRRAIPLTVAATLAVTLAAGVSHGVTAQDTQSMKGQGHRRECSDATLRGDYGRLSSGIRPAPVNPALTESFVGTGLRTYDGQGGFTEISSSHGQISPPNRNTPGTGTYEVNADCTGSTGIHSRCPVSDRDELRHRRSRRRGQARGDVAAASDRDIRRAPGWTISARKRAARAHDHCRCSGWARGQIGGAPLRTDSPVRTAPVLRSASEIKISQGFDCYPCSSR
jgi:hypothetical protein